MADLEAFLERIKAQVSAEDHVLAEKLIGSYAYLSDLVDQDKTTIGELQRLLGKPKNATEKTRDVVGSKGGNAASSAPLTDDRTGKKKGKKRKGHGRTSADAYKGAKRVTVGHKTLSAGDPCPKPRCKGIVYKQKKPSVLIRITGQAPIQATAYELERLRCNVCGEMHTAAAPEGVGDQKYDAKSAAMIALLKYGSGLPFNRLAGLQSALHTPLPASTQWEVVRDAASAIQPAFDELVLQAAQGEVLYNDDTGVKILELLGKRKEKHPEVVEAASAKDGVPLDRTGLHTTGVVSTCDGKKIALFFSGRRHAGENLREVLNQRASELGRPIQMCDALALNCPGDLEAVVANCIAHCRRNFVDEAASFPTECRHVLEELAIVYKNDASAKKQGLSPEARLAFHQTESAPVMKRLETWLHTQFDERLVEPNSGLGKAIKYATNHWDKLTRFLHEPGAPLDNNICERALKKAILHRRNSLFYKTQDGAAVGDLYMSLIYTCQLAGESPFDYVTALVEHANAVAEQPGDWMPWTFREAVGAAGE